MSTWGVQQEVTKLSTAPAYPLQFPDHLGYQYAQKMKELNDTKVIELNWVERARAKVSSCEVVLEREISEPVTSSDPVTSAIITTAPDTTTTPLSPSQQLQVDQMLQALQSRDVAPPAEATPDWSTLSAKKLKAFCTQYGLDTSGTKAVLIQRLKDYKSQE